MLMVVAAVAFDAAAHLPFFRLRRLGVSINAFGISAATETLLNLTILFALVSAGLSLFAAVSPPLRRDWRALVPVILVGLASLITLVTGLIAVLVLGYHQVHKSGFEQMVGASTSYGAWVLYAVVFLGWIPFVIGPLVPLLARMSQETGATSAETPQKPVPSSAQTGPQRSAAPAATVGQATTTGQELAQLAELYQNGLLTDDEFAAAKARLLSP